MNEEDTPDYCIGEVWPDGTEQRGLMAYDADAKPFHLGQSYEDVAAKPIKCGKCGGNEFHVGQGSFYTAIRCVRCEWECGIHDG